MTFGQSVSPALFDLLRGRLACRARSGASGLPVLAVDRKWLAQVGNVGSAFHVEDDGDAHAIPH